MQQYGIQANATSLHAGLVQPGSTPPRDTLMLAVLGAVEHLIQRSRDIQFRQAQAINNLFGSPPEPPAKESTPPSPGSFGELHDRLGTLDTILSSIAVLTDRLEALA